MSLVGKENLAKNGGNVDSSLTGVHVPEVTFAEKILKAKRIFMNSSPTKPETPSESLLGKLLGRVSKQGGGQGFFEP